MGLMFTGIFLNLLASFYVSFYITETSSGSGIDGFIVGIFIYWGISLIGGILAVLGQRKLGPILVFIGSILFFPLGMVAVFGAIKVKNQAEPEQPDLELRRQLAKKKTQNHE